jgi:hypothetical protein
MKGEEIIEAGGTSNPLNWNLAIAKKKVFNIGISSLKDSVELYARRPIIIPLYDFKNPFGVRILETEKPVNIAAIVPFDGCSFSDIYLLSNADMNKVMQSNPLIIGTPMRASNLKESSAIMDLTDKIIVASVYGSLKASAGLITKLYGFTPIMYDDGNYSYSSLNLINVDNSLFIAPFELIESTPGQAGE